MLSDAALTPLAIAFGWFPTELPGAWLIWSVTYVVILALSSLLFTGLYRRETKLLNKQLERYKIRDSEASQVAEGPIEEKSTANERPLKSFHGT